MVSNLISLKYAIPLDVLIPEKTYGVRSVHPKRTYENGVVTERIEGYTYGVFNRRTYDFFSVTVKEVTPTLSQEEIEKEMDNGTPPIVQFINARVKPYLDKRSGTMAESITAEGIVVVNDDLV